MANLNKVMLIGRLTRDPEVRSFATGGKVAAFGFATRATGLTPCLTSLRMARRARERTIRLR